MNGGYRKKRLRKAIARYTIRTALMMAAIQLLNRVCVLLMCVCELKLAKFKTFFLTFNNSIVSADSLDELCAKHTTANCRLLMFSMFGGG